ncbi:MAG: Tar ligand binding domain-containing protein, partial [Nostocales cyanobacterium ELA583]
MLKNSSLQTRLVSGFLSVGLIVLIVGMIGWSGFTRMSEYLKTFSDNTLPSTVSLWKVADAQSRLIAADNRLLSTVIGMEERKKDITKAKSALQDIKDGWDSYQKLPRDPEEDRIYKEISREQEKLSATAEEFFLLNEEAMRYGIINPRKIQIQLLKEGKANSPEFITAEAVSKAFSKMIDFSITRLEPSFIAANNSTMKLLEYNANLSDKTKKKADDDVNKTNILILFCSIIGPITAVVLGFVISNQIIQKVNELVKVSKSIANSNSTTQMQLSGGKDELVQLQTAFYTVASKIGELVTIAEKISSGDLKSQIQPTDSQDEMGKLQNAFYTMNKDL